MFKINRRNFLHYYLPTLISVVLIVAAGIWYQVFITYAGGGTGGNGTHGFYVQQGGKFRQVGGRVEIGGNGFNRPAFVQGCSNQVSNGTNFNCVFGSNVTAGDLIAIGIGQYGVSATQVTGITDNCNTAGTSDTYTIVDNGVIHPAGIYIGATQGYAVIGETGSCTITIAVSGGTYIDAIAHEVSGVNTATPIDNSQYSVVGQYAPGTGTDALTGNNVTTTVADDYIFGWSFDGSVANNSFTAGTNFTDRVTQTGTGVNEQSEDRIQASAGDAMTTFTVNVGTGGFAVGIMAFSPRR